MPFLISSVRTPQAVGDVGQHVRASTKNVPGAFERHGGEDPAHRNVVEPSCDIGQRQCVLLREGRYDGEQYIRVELCKGPAWNSCLMSLGVIAL